MFHIYYTFLVSGPSGHPIDFSRMDLSPEVIEQFDDQDLDQYLPPPGMGHPLVQHNSHHGDSAYSACYIAGPMQAASSGLSGWASSYRMTSTSSSSCLPPYMAQNSSTVAPPPHTMQAPYDLSEQGASDNRSPPIATSSTTSRGTSSQASPQNLATSENFLNTNISECKYRNDDACSIKMEQQQSQVMRSSSNLQSSFRCDPKYETSAFSGSQSSARYSLDSGSNIYTHMSGPYVPQNGAASHGTPSGYQYNMSLHRQGMFNAIPAAVPAEQNWERFG